MWEESTTLSKHFNRTYYLCNCTKPKPNWTADAEQWGQIHPCKGSVRGRGIIIMTDSGRWTSGSPRCGTCFTAAWACTCLHVLGLVSYLGVWIMTLSSTVTLNMKEMAYYPFIHTRPHTNSKSLRSCCGNIEVVDAGLKRDETSGWHLKQNESNAGPNSKLLAEHKGNMIP